jgi:hypothetical protein
MLIIWISGGTIDLDPVFDVFGDEPRIIIVELQAV